MPDQPSNDKTVQSPRRSSSDQFELQVMSEGGVQRFALPPAGEVTIGRGDQATFRVEDGSLSRLHASLRVGLPFRLTDLGSSNKTYFRDVPLRPHESVDIYPGDLFELGSVFCTIRGGALGGRRKYMRDHGYFEQRLDDACEAADGSTSFAVLHVVVDAQVDASPVEAYLLESSGAGDVIARYATNEYRALLHGVNAVVVDTRIKALHELASEDGVRVGSALYPRDGRSRHPLIERAEAAILPTEATVSGGITVVDPMMRRLHLELEKVAQSTIDVMLLGETGVGKDVFAQRLHACSARRSKPFVVVNCAAIVGTLAESSLFGHEKNSFTGAKEHIGFMEAAHGGTLFLDEVGELPLEIQSKLLRALQERKVLRVGANFERPIDVRVVSATNRNLREEIRAGNFREDLYYRLNGFDLTIPRLARRVVEIAPLARHFAAEHARRDGRSAPRISPAALALLEGYHWPGNVRQLGQGIRRAVVLADDEITPEHLPEELRVRSVAPAHLPADGVDPAWTPAELAERARVMATLEQCGNNQTHAAKRLEITRRKIIDLIVKYRLVRPQKRGA